MTRNLYRSAQVLGVLGLLLATVHCGSNTAGKSVVVTITSPSAAQTVPVNGTLPISASVMNTSNKGVTWSVNGAAGGNATFGTIAGSGLTVVYTAPVSVPAPATFNITVTSAADTSKSASLMVTISAGVEVSITTPTSPQSLSVSSVLAFTAVVAGTSNTGVTWTVNGFTNGNSTYGTITGSGLAVMYTAPPTVPVTGTFNVTATSAEDNTKSASVSVTITAGVGIVITTPASATASVPAQGGLALSAAVYGTVNTAVTWSVNGVTNGNAAYGTILGTGLVVTFDAPVSIPTPATYNITVTSQADSSKSASVSVTITASKPLACGTGNEAILNGQYAFLLKGFNHSGFQGIVGSITADGEGHITAGEVDLNGTGAASATHTLVVAAPTSSYSVGADDRGCATIITASGTTLKTRFDLGAISGTGATQGQIMEFDTANSSAFVATGGIYQQNSSNFFVLEGGAYVHLLTGWDGTAQGRVACGGIHTNSGGNISNSEETCNSTGTFATTGPIVGSSGTYSTIDTNGRFTETIGATNLVNYFVTQNAQPGVPSEVILTTNANPVLAGESTFQTVNTYSQSSLVGDYVISANGVNGSTQGKIFLSTATSDGSSKLTLNTYDENDGGTWHNALVPTALTYNVDFLGGVSLTTIGPVNAGQLYLTGGPFAVYIGADAGGFAGYAVAQTGTGSLDNAALSGTFFGGGTEVVNQNVVAESDLEVNNAAGAISLTTDSTSIEAQSVGQLSVQTIETASNGTFTSTANPLQIIGVTISPNFYVTVGSATTAYPTLLFFTLNTPPL
jgi:hypothetical protein